MILELYIENWKSHQKTSLKFTEGTNVLVGIMGSGKTSILDAVNFGLFGTFPALKQKRIALKDVIRKKPNKAKSAQVKVRFQAADGKTYEVKRTIEKGTQAELRLDGNLLEVSPNRVTERVEKLLKVDYDLFSRAIYSEQNQIDHFLKIPKGKRKEKIDELLRIDKFEKARKTASSLGTRLADVINEKEEWLRLEEKDMQQLEGLAIETSETEKKRRKALEQFKESTRKKEELENRLKRLEEKKNTHTALKARIEELEKREKELTERAGKYERTELTKEQVTREIALKQERLKELERKEKELRKRENEKQERSGEKKNLEETIREEQERIVPVSKKEIETLREARETTEKEHALLANEEKELAGKKIGLQRIVDALETELSEKRRKKELLGTLDPAGTEKKLEGTGRELEKARQKRERVKAREEFLENGIKELKDRRNCPLCETKLEEKRIEEIEQERGRELEEQKQNILTLKEKIRELEKEKEILEDTQIKIKRLELVLSDHEEKINEHESKKKELSEKKKELKEKEEDSRNSKEKLEKLGKKLEGKEKALELAQEVERKKEKLAKIERELAQIETEILPLSREYDREIEKREREGVEGLRNILEGVKIRQDMEKARLDLERKREDAAKLKYKEKKHEEEEKEYRKTIIEWSDANSEFNSLSAELIEKKHRIEEGKQKKERTDKMRSEIDKMKKNTDHLKEFQNALTSTQIALREEFIQVVNESMDSIWSQLYPYQDYTSARIEIEKGDYALRLLGSNGWTPIETVSGGERAVAVLALRVAFSLVLAPQLKWLILDEPTHNLDEKGIDELSTLLREKIGEYMDQVFIITHEPALEQAATGYLYRLERDKSMDEPTRAVAVDVGR